MSRILLFILTFLFCVPQKDIQAQEVQPIDLLMIDFWVDGARVDDQIAQNFESGIHFGYTFEPEEILLARLYKGLGDIQQAVANNNTRKSLNRIILSASEIYGSESCNEGLARVALGMCDEETPDRAISVCRDGIAMIEALNGRECREWALAMTFLAYLYLEADQLSLAQSGFEDAINGYASGSPYYCMPSIVFLQKRTIDLAEQGHTEHALCCAETITRLLDLFTSNQKALEDAYKDLPQEYTPVCDYDMVGRTYINITYIYGILKKYEEGLFQADKGLSVLEKAGLENTYSYAAIINNKAEIYQSQQDLQTARQWFNKARVKLEQIGETHSSLYEQICDHLK